MLHTLGLPRRIVNQLFENALSTNMSDDELLQLFGERKYFTFTNAADVLDTAAPLHEFGPTKVSQKARKAIYDSLPEQFKEIIPEENKLYFGTYDDNLGRRYKKEEQLNGIESRWSVLIPKGKIQSLNFPEIGETISFKQDGHTHKYLVTDISPSYQNSAIVLLVDE